MKIGQEVWVHGYVDEIRKDTVIIRNEGGYFGTVPGEIRENRNADGSEAFPLCFDVGGHTYGVIGGDEAMRRFREGAKE